MTKRWYLLATSVLLVTLLTSCTTTNETDPAKVSMGDLLFGKKRLDNHLASRRAELDKLMDESAELSLRLNGRERTLREINDDYNKKAEASKYLDAEETQLKAEAAVRQEELELVQDKLEKLNDKLKLMRDKASSDRAVKDELQKQIANNEKQIADLEKEVVVLERAIDRIITVRARHALETS